MEPPEPYVVGDLTVDFAQRRVTLAGRQVHLTPTEYGVLAELAAHAGRVVTHEHLLERVWGERGRGSGSLRPLRTMVGKLRRKLGDDADHATYIFTEPRVGFRMPRGGDGLIFPSGTMAARTPQVPFWRQRFRQVPSYRRWQWSAAGTPSLVHTVTGPVTGPAKARSSVAVSIGSVPAAARKLYSPRAVSQTTSRGNGRPDAAIRR